ncbi:GD24778 [Drosophila simulans]|uniref:GD24778 n=1 Tax=Drosophila simulans TaxID=7240 RepID=B4NV03_DROSI|nr:GD24778 [Drosophila simulans]
MSGSRSLDFNVVQPFLCQIKALGTPLRNSQILHHRSSLLVMNAVVPQGSLIDPFLYTLYTADMTVPSHSSPSTKVLVALYADDTLEH